MNFLVSEMTELALQILDYRMYDRNGKPTDSLCRLIKKHQVGGSDSELTDLTGEDDDEEDEEEDEGHVKPAKQRKRSASPAAASNRGQWEQEDKFLAEFDIQDVYSVQDDPNRYVEKQMKSLFTQLQERILQTSHLARCKSEVKELLEMNAKVHQKEVVSFCATVRKGCAKAIKSVEEDCAGTWPQTATEIRRAREEQKNELLDEFTMLLQVLKIILDDLPDDWKELDKILRLLQTSNDALRYIS